MKAIDYLNKKKTNSEISEGIQHIKQLNSQIRSKRSDDSLKLPGNFKVGQAIGGGDCFFDSVTQGLKQLKPKIDFSVQVLRKVCRRRAIDNQQLRDKVIRDAKNNHDPTVVLPDPSISDDELWNAYLASIEYAGEEIEIMHSNNPSLYESITSLKYGSTLQAPIWGRPDIEGQLICNEYHIKLHIIEKSPHVGYLNQVVDGSVSRSVDSVDYNDINAIHILNEGKAHFKPILYTQRIQHKRESSDYDDEITPEEELINTIKSNDSEEEKLAKIKRLFEKEPKPDINYFQGKDSDTSLHIAIRKGELKVIKLLVQKGAKVNDDSVRNKRNRTPLDTAKQKAKFSKRQDIVEILEPNIQSNLQASAQQPSTQQKRTRTNSEEVESEDSNPKKQKTSSTDVQPMGVDQDTSSKKRPHKDEENAVQGKKTKLSTLSNSEQSSDIQENRKPIGLLTSYHGIAYQMKWMMVVALEAQERLNGKKSGAFKFRTVSFKTEDPDAGKFDDLVWRYETDKAGLYEYNFLQAKHKLDKEEKITLKGLLKPKQKEDSLKSNEKDKRPFALEKYFLSYRDEIKKKYNGKINKLIIATNIDFDNDLKKSSLEPLKDNIPILDFIEGKKPENLGFKKGDFPHRKEIKEQLEGTYDLIKIARDLGKCILNNEPIKKDGTLNSYLSALEQNRVIESSGKFHSHFTEEDHQNLPKEAKQLRIAFFQEAFTNKRKSLGFSIDYKISYPEELAEQIASKIIESFNNLKKEVTIKKTKKVLGSCIDDLAGYVLIEKDGGIRFNPNFWALEDNKLPSDSLRTFRDKLKSQLESKIKNSRGGKLKFFKEQVLNAFINEFKEYQFNIGSKGAFRTCKEILADKDAFWKNVKDFKFDQFDRSNLDQSSSELPSHELKDIEEGINRFFGQLVFVVNYPQETLDEFIKKKCAWFVGFETDYVAYEFQARIANALNLKAREFISTAEEVDNFFKEAKDRLNSLVLIGPTLLYKAQIEEYDVKFQESCIKELFKYNDNKDNEKSYDFLDSDKKVLSLVTEQNDLTAIKVYQAIGQYQEQGGYIFMGLSSVLRMKDHVLSAFGERDLLIIECDYTNKDVQGLYSSLKSKLNGNKKIILITKENDLLANKFKPALRDKYQEKIDEKNSLTGLTPESQVKLLERGKVTFQGEKGVSLGTLVDDGSKHLIDGEVLSKLINKEKIEIGKALKDSKYDNVKDYYISRTFNRQVKIRQDFAERSEFLVIELGKGGVKEEEEEEEVNDQNLKEDQDIVLISDIDDRFSELCNKNKEHNIHWLKQEGNEYVWQRSRGDLSKLREFVYKSEQSIQEYKPEKITDIKDRIVIISAEPGMGKSTVLTPLALKTKDSLWVIRINLLDYSTALKIETEKKTKLNEAEAIKFLYRIVGFQLFQGEKEETTEKKGKRKQTVENVLRAINVKDSKISLDRKSTQDLDLLEIELFNNFYNQGRIVLLFDGFDEISPDYTEKVIELLQVLKNSKVEKLWITTRPYNFIQEKLENQLSIFSYSLKPLFPEEQKDFLRKFWKAKLKLNELDDQRSGVFIDELLDKLPIGDKDFMSIPLHASMVAEVFTDAFKSFYDSNEKELSDKYKRNIEELDLATLYDKFIDIKFYKIRFGEKKPVTNTDDPDMRGMVEKEHKEFIEDHMKLALYEIFNKNEVEKLVSREEMGKVSELIDKITLGNEKTGLIEQVIDNKPKFIHRTFEEYFVASYFWESFKSVQSDKFEDFIENTIIKNLIKDDRVQISKFLQLKAKKDFESNIDFSGKQDKLKTLLTKLLGQTKKYDYSDSNKQSTKLLFGIVEFSFFTKEGSGIDVIEPNWPLYSYYHDQLKLLCVSAEMGYIKLANALETKLNTEFLQEYLRRDKWFYSPLWLAAKNAHLDVLEILVKKFSYDPNWNDKDLKTLVQRIFQRGEFDVLRSCLKLYIIDGKAYKDLNGQEKLPILDAFNGVAPSDVIKLLIERTDSNLVNRFQYSGSSDLSPAKLIAVRSLKYGKEITELAIKKGIDFSDVTNLLLFEFRYESLNSPINKLNLARPVQPSFHSDKEFLNLFGIIEVLLKAGVGYNSEDTRYSKTTLQYAEQIHYIHKLLEEVHKLCNQKSDKNSNPLGTILKLIIDNISSSPDFVGYRFVVDQAKKCIMLEYKDQSSKYNKIISILPDNIPKLLFKFHEDSNTNLVESTLCKFRDYITNAKEEIEVFKQYPDRKVYNQILTGYEEMFKFSYQFSFDFSHQFSLLSTRKEQYQSLDEYEKDLLARVLNLYIRQDYKIYDALEEVSEKVLRFEEIINKLKESSGSKEYETEEILAILAVKNIDTNEELQDLISKIYKCKGIELLSETWSNLNQLGQKSIMGTLKLIFKFADQSSKNFELLKKLDDSYNTLTKAIQNKNYQEMNNILQNIEPDFIKAIINGQDDEYGSPLHYAALKGDEKATTILLDHRANPDLKMQGSVILLSTAEQDEDLEHDYQGCTPLHLAAQKGRKEVVEVLLKNGAHYDVKNKEGEVPLDLAESVPVKSLLCDIGDLFKAVQGDEQDKVDTLLKKYERDTDILKVIVNARDTDSNTPLHYAAQEGYSEVVKLLLDRGVDRTIVNGNGNTPLQLAEEHLDQNPQMYQEIVDVLKSVNQQQKTRQQLGKVSAGECLPGPSSGRRKREAVEECLFTWEDVDEFNEEKDEKRDSSKIKIDSEKFVSYIKDLPEEKQSQLIQLASGVKVIGESQSLVNKLISNQKVMNHLGRVGKVSGMTMHGMMAKNVLADFLNGNYQGVAINLGFIAGGQGFSRVAQATAAKGTELASEGKLLLGRSLRVASPFLARGTSAFVVYDLVNQIKAFKNGTEEALVGVVGDSIYLGVDAAEIGVEVAEGLGVLEGVSSVTGPIGAAIGAVVFVGTDVYMAVKRVDKIDQIIHLTGGEKFVEGLRAFIGMQPEQYVQELMEEKQLNNQLIKQGLEYLKQHSDVQKYVFPTKKIVCNEVINNKTVCVIPGTYDGICIEYEIKTFYTEKCTPVIEMDSRVILDRKRTDIRWSRAKPDNPNEGQLFCLPQGNDEPAPSYGSYLCENAIGLSANKTGNHTLIALGEGHDKVFGFRYSPNIFLVEDGYKEFTGGDKDDFFILMGNTIEGMLYGEDGIDTLDLSKFAQNAVNVDLYLSTNIGDIIYGSPIIRIAGIERILGRKANSERMFSSCDTQFLDGQGSTANSSDVMIIKNEVENNVCTYKVQIVVRPNTNIINQAYNGEFNYIILPGKGKAVVNISSLLDGAPTDRHNFFFNSTISELVGIYIQNVNQAFNYTVKSATFSFLSTENKSESEFDSQLNKGGFNITISDIPVNASYTLSNGAQIKIGRKGNMYMLESTDKSSEEVIRDYLPIANRVSKMSFFIQSLLSNETVVIGSGNHEVIHNNPSYRSHLVGNGGENVYVIESETTEVIIHDIYEENSIDTIDLRNVVKRGNYELKVIRSENDLLLRATGEGSLINCTVRLKDGVERYNKTHVILENVPMIISFDNNEWSLKPQPLMFEEDKEIIVVTGQDVEEGNEIITPRKGGNYKFVRSNDNDLMITNAFDLTITKNDLCSITLSKFYETPRMKTLFIKFADKEIVLKDHEKEISAARNIDIVTKEYKDQVHDDVFNRNPEVIMLSDQPVTHRHRHSRHTRHRWSTTSSSTRPTGWINDLFSWVKSSVSGLLSSKPTLSDETSSTSSLISQVDAKMDVNGTIMLLDLLIRKVTGQKYISTADQSISPLEAQGYALNITGEFEKVVEQAAKDSKISMHRLNIDYMGIQKEIAGKVMSGKFNEISGILNSYVEKACPGREAGCPGKLSPKKFDKFMIQFNSRLNIILNQSIEQILHNRDSRLEVDGAKQMSLEPQSYLSNASVRSHSKVSTYLSEIGVTKLGGNLNR